MLSNLGFRLSLHHFLFLFHILAAIFLIRSSTVGSELVNTTYDSADAPLPSTDGNQSNPHGNDDESVADGNAKKIANKKSISGFRLLETSIPVLTARGVVWPLDHNRHIKSEVPFKLKHEVDMNLSLPDILAVNVQSNPTELIEVTRSTLRSVGVPDAPMNFLLYSEGAKKKFIRRNSRDKKLTCLEGGRYTQAVVQKAGLVGKAVYVRIRLPWETDQDLPPDLEPPQKLRSRIWSFSFGKDESVKGSMDGYIPLQPDMSITGKREPVSSVEGKSVTVACVKEKAEPFVLEGVAVQVPLYRDGPWRVAVEPHAMRVYKSGKLGTYIFTGSFIVYPKSMFVEGGPNKDNQVWGDENAGTQTSRSDVKTKLPLHDAANDVDLRISEHDLIPQEEIKSLSSNGGTLEANAVDFVTAQSEEAELDESVSRLRIYTGQQVPSSTVELPFIKRKKRIYRDVSKYSKKKFWAFSQLPTHGPDVVFVSEASTSNLPCSESYPFSESKVIAFTAKVKASSAAPILHAMKEMEGQYCLLVRRVKHQRVELRCPCFYKMQEELNALKVWENAAAETDLGLISINAGNYGLLAYLSQYFALLANKELWNSSEGRRHQTSMVGFDSGLGRSKFVHLINPLNFKVALKENNSKVKSLAFIQSAGMMAATVFLMLTTLGVGRSIYAKYDKESLLKKALDMQDKVATKVVQQLGDLLLHFRATSQAQFYCIRGKKL